jgi:ankyrin repeat protein
MVTTLNTLPSELLMHVIAYLPNWQRLGKLSKHFNQSINDNKNNICAKKFRQRSYMVPLGDAFMYYRYYVEHDYFSTPVNVFTKHDDFWHAINHGHTYVVRLVFLNSYNPFKNISEYESLKKSIEVGNISIVKMLLAYPGDLNENIIPLVPYAVSGDNIELVRLLLSDPRVVITYDYSDQISIIGAVQHDQIEMTRLLLSDPRFDPSADNNKSIVYAAQNGNIEMAKMLLSDPRVDPSVDHNQAIRCASQNGHNEIVRLLLSDPRTDPNTFNGSLIFKAVSSSNIEMVKFLLAHPKIDASIIYNGALRIAESANNFEIITLLKTDKKISALEDAIALLSVVSKIHGVCFNVISGRVSWAECKCGSCDGHY